jgi:transcription antitermination protein NusB
MSPRRPGRRPPPRALRSAARLYAVQALFQMEAAGADLDACARSSRPTASGSTPTARAQGDADIDHFRAVLAEAVNHQARIDQLTDRALVAKWPIDRIDPTLRALFRAAGAEIVALETPPKVAISEYVAVARAFFPAGREKSFVNAVLDHMAREARPDAFA